MTAPVAVPIAIGVSPSRSGPARGLSPTDACGSNASAFRSESRSPQTTREPTTSTPSRNAKHERRSSRIEVLTELLLPEPAVLDSSFAGLSLGRERKPSTAGPSPVDVKRSEALRTRLGRIDVETVLEATTSQSRSRSPLLLSEDASIDAACQLLVVNPDLGPIVLIDARSAQQASSKEGTRAHQVISESHCVGLLSLEDIHAFLAMLFCPASAVVAQTDSSARSSLSSPPPSPVFGRKGAVSCPDSIACTMDKARELRALIQAKKSIPSKLIANLSGANAFRAMPSIAKMDQVVAELTDPSVGYLAICRQDESGPTSRPVAGPKLRGLISRRDVLDALIREASHDTQLAAVLSERIDELPSLGFTGVATLISSDKTVLDAMTLISSEGLRSVAILDPRGVFLSPLSSAELAFEVIRSHSRKVLNTSLAALVKAMRSRQPEGMDGKDTHPAMSISLSSELARAVSLMQATSAQGIFVLDDLVSTMTPPLSTFSPSSPNKELGWWMESTGCSGRTSEGPDGESGSACKPVNPRRSSTSFWTAPRSRLSATPTSAPGVPLTKVFAASEGREPADAKGGQQPRPSSNSAHSSSFSSTSSPISATVGGPGFVRGHRPRSLSLAHALGGEVSLVRRDSTARANPNTAGPLATEAATSLSRSSSTSDASSTVSSSHSSVRSGDGGGSIFGSHAYGSLPNAAGAPLASTGPLPISTSPHTSVTGPSIGYAEGTSLAPVRYHLSAATILRFVAHCAGLKEGGS